MLMFETLLNVFLRLSIIYIKLKSLLSVHIYVSCFLDNCYTYCCNFCAKPNTLYLATPSLLKEVSITAVVFHLHFVQPLGLRTFRANYSQTSKDDMIISIIDCLDY